MKEKTGINGFTIKIIAVLTMVCDHMAVIFFSDAPFYFPMRCIGRIAFVLFAFLLVEGAVHTQHARRYLALMILFSFLSEIPYDLAFHQSFPVWNDQNIFFTLLLGLILILICKKIPLIAFTLPIALVLCLAAEFALQSDYGAAGILIIYIFYLLRNRPVWMPAIGFAVISVLLLGIHELFGLIAFLPIFFYNQKRGPGVKYFFYIFYPAHLLLFALIRLFLLG